jgi:hypothetical protein
MFKYTNIMVAGRGIILFFVKLDLQSQDRQTLGRLLNVLAHFGR